MLDENLPTFFFRPSSETPLRNFVYFTYLGSEPAPEYLFQKADPALPQSKNKYASALGDAVAQDVIFGEVLIEPEFQQPTLSAAEIRAQGSAPPPPVPMIPDSFAIQLYNPDQKITVKGEKSAWTGKESWEFEMPQQSFRRPSGSTLDRQQSNEAIASLAPKVTFRWKRDGKFTKDMTCYMTGTSVNGKKSKDPDITVAMFKHGREHSVTIYEPNLQRVDVEDRKGLEVVILLGAEVIREIYLSPSRDSFNVSGAAGAAAAAAAAAPQKRRDSRPSAPVGSSGSPAPQVHFMSSAIGSAVPSPPPRTATAPPVAVQQQLPQQQQKPISPVTATAADARKSRNQAAVDAETRRLQAEVEEEGRRERRRREREEERRTKKMLKEEEKERRRLEAEVEKETERLRKQYGVEGQDFGPRPSLPPRPAAAAAAAAAGAAQTQNLHPNRHQPGGSSNALQPPPRPSSAGPGLRHHHHGNGGLSRLFRSSSPNP